MRTREAVLVLHNIRSAHNVGALLRTADAAGISRAYLSGYTPRPKDAFGKINTGIAKTALGAEHTLSWESARSAGPLLSKMKRQGFVVVAVEQAPGATNYRRVRLKKPKVAFVLGNEVRGLDRRILARADVVAEIPMRGKKESLNVAVAGGIVLFSVLGI